MKEPPAYEREPALTRIETSVVRAAEDDGRPFVTLADTVLYPEGGGQPADHGTVAGTRVLDVQWVEGEVRHYLAEAMADDRVTVTLDWDRRFDHMQQHTAQHLLTAVAESRFGWRTAAFHLGETVSDIELDTPGVRPEQMLELEESVATEIRAARPVRARRVSPVEYGELPIRSRGLPDGHTGSVRLIEIEGIDVCNCGGTHCSSTSQLEALKLLGTESVRGGTRLFYVAGRRARRLLGAHHHRQAELRSVLGTSDDQLVDSVRLKLDQLKQMKRQLREVEEELAVAVAAELAHRADPVLTAHWPHRGLPFLQMVARAVHARVSDRVVFLTAGEGEEGAFLVSAGAESAADIPTVGAQVAEVLGGRGGGAGRVYQGRATALSRREEVPALLE